MRPGLASHGGRPGGLCGGPKVAVVAAHRFLGTFLGGGIGWAFKAGFSWLLNEVTSGGGRRSAAVNLRSLNYACGGGFMF